MFRTRVHLVALLVVSAAFVGAPASGLDVPACQPIPAPPDVPGVVDGWTSQSDAVCLLSVDVFAGDVTQIGALADALREAGATNLVVAEPGLLIVPSPLLSCEWYADPPPPRVECVPVGGVSGSCSSVTATVWAHGKDGSVGVTSKCGSLVASCGVSVPPAGHCSRTARGWGAQPFVCSWTVQGSDVKYRVKCGWD